MLYIFFNLMFTYARLENFSLHLYVKSYSSVQTVLTVFTNLYYYY